MSCGYMDLWTPGSSKGVVVACRRVLVLAEAVGREGGWAAVLGAAGGCHRRGSK